MLPREARAEERQQERRRRKPSPPALRPVQEAYSRLPRASKSRHIARRNRRCHARLVANAYSIDAEQQCRCR